MQAYHAHPTSKFKSANGYNEVYKLENIDSIELKRLTYSGGYGDIAPSSEERIIVVKKGTGVITLQGQNHLLENGSVLEIPSAQLIQLNEEVGAQIIFYIARGTKGNHSIETSSFHYSGKFQTIEPSSKDRLFIAQKGMAFAVIGSKTVRVEEGTVLEIPANETIQLSSATIDFQVISTR